MVGMNLPAGLHGLALSADCECDYNVALRKVYETPDRPVRPVNACILTPTSPDLNRSDWAIPCNCFLGSRKVYQHGARANTV